MILDLLILMLWIFAAFIIIHFITMIIILFEVYIFTDILKIKNIEKHFYTPVINLFLLIGINISLLIYFMNFIIPNMKIFKLIVKKIKRVYYEIFKQKYYIKYPFINKIFQKLKQRESKK